MRSLLYQVNTRCSLKELEPRLRRPATFDDLSDEQLEQWSRLGADFVWLLGVWQVGPIVRQLARGQRSIREEYGRHLPELHERDIVGSVFAIQQYEVDRELGGGDSLQRLRARMAERKLRLVLDFVPNHAGIDHPWAYDHPERFVHGTEELLAREPENYVRVPTRHGTQVLAYGRDPNFAGWCDTLQLNYASASCRRAMLDELMRIATLCDGLRCDMAMLLEPEVFARTWGARARPADGAEPVLAPFWPEAIGQVRRFRPDFLFIAEVYWDMEWRLQQEGFDFTYDKRLYDRLKEGRARPVREHLHADGGYQSRLLRFLENHDESRAARAFTWPKHRAAATITLLLPGMTFVHDGQMEGRAVHVPMQVCRRPSEQANPKIRAHYEAILECAQSTEVHRGVWSLWPCRPTWDVDPSWDQFIVFTWSLGERWLLVAANYGPARGHCHARIGLPGLRGRRFVLRDRLSDACYEREGDQLAGTGLYLEMAPWEVHVFSVEPV